MRIDIYQCILSGDTVQSLAALYAELVRQLPFPDHFGYNLDALWDVLTTDLEGPVELIWNDAAASCKGMGNDFDKVMQLLQEVAAKREDFRIIIR